MRTLHKPRSRAERRSRRHLRVRKRVSGTAARPRLVVFRSLKHIYAQLVDDDQGRTLMATSDRSKDLVRERPGKVGLAHAVGKLLAERAKPLGVTRIVFDRAGYLYHGRVRAVAEGARAAGLEF
jgi:large subunit ribosomal protein L18